MSVFKSIWDTINAAFSVSRQDDGSLFYQVSGGSSFRDTSDTKGQLEAYNLCAPLNGIVNRKARAFTNAKLYLLDAKGNEATSAYASKIRKLLTRPNVLQSWNQFIAQGKVFEQLFGEVFIYAVRPEGRTSPEQTAALWIIPNWIMTIKLTGKLFLQNDIKDIIESYKITYNGVTTPIPIDQIIHIRDINQSSTSLVFGESRLTSLSNPITNIIAAYESRNVLITRKGAIGILSNSGKDAAGSIPLKETEKNDLQQEYKKYGMSKSQWQVIITNASLKWQSMTFPTKDLMLFEEIEDDVRQIADNFDYPIYLLGFKNGSTYNNVNEAKKSLYQDAIIPEFDGWVETLNSYFNTEKAGFSISAWFDHLDIFQKSKKEEAEAMKVTNEAFNIAYEKKIVTLQEWRAAIDLDPDNFTGNTFYDGAETNTNAGADQGAEEGETETN